MGTTSWSLPFPVANFATAGGGDGTYVVKSFATDSSGNIQAPAATATFSLDNTPPSNLLTLTAQSPAGASFMSGNTVYFRGTGGGSGGTFKIRDAVTDSGSGPASSATAALGGTTTGWTSAPGTVSTPAGGPYDSGAFSWAEGTSSQPTETISGADAAGNTAAAPLTFTNDSTAPTAGAFTVNGQTASGAGHDKLCLQHSIRDRGSYRLHRCGVRVGLLGVDRAVVCPLVFQRDCRRHLRSSIGSIQLADGGERNDPAGRNSERPLLHVCPHRHRQRR